MIPKRFVDIVGTIDGLDVLFVDNRGSLTCNLRKTGTSRKLPFGLVWRFLTGATCVASEQTMFDALTTDGDALLRAVEKLEGPILKSIEARERLLAVQELVKIGIMTENHPSFREAAAAARLKVDDFR